MTVQNINTITYTIETTQINQQVSNLVLSRVGWHIISESYVNGEIIKSFPVGTFSSKSEAESFRTEYSILVKG